jgi:FkbM family methyltransferase
MHPALRSVRYGRTLRDRAVIGLHLATVPLFPLGVVARRIGKPLPDPRAWFGEYVVQGPGGLFACPSSPSPFFLGADASYEPGLSTVIEALQGGLFVDVGASIGFITVRAARRAGHVIAIEPHPVRFAFLERNVELNGLTNVTCLNYAAGAEQSTIALYDVDPTLGPHPLDVSTQPGPGRRHDVPLRRLDDLVGEEAELVKIDVEGDELEVVLGAARLLRSKPLLVVESLDENHRSALQEHLPGYSFREIDPNSFLCTP